MERCQELDEAGGTRPSCVSGRSGWCSSTPDEYPSQWKAIESVAEKLDINRETLRVWVRRAEVDEGRRPGVTTDERARLSELEREVKELRRANEILKRRRLTSRRSWTATAKSSRVHRRTPGTVRGRADLQGAHRARLCDRPEHLLDGPQAAPWRGGPDASSRSRSSGSTTRTSSWTAPPRSGPNSTPKDPCRSLHRRAADAGDGPGRRRGHDRGRRRAGRRSRLRLEVARHRDE